MAEWLGTGLQNLLQRFDSAWYLKKASGRWSGGVFFVILSRPSTIEPVSVLGVGKIKGPCTVEGVFVLGVGKIKGPCTIETVFVLWLVKYRPAGNL